MLRRALEFTASGLRRSPKPDAERRPERAAEPQFETYRNPEDLSRTATTVDNVLLIGSCLAEVFGRFAPSPLKVDFVFFNNQAELPAPPRLANQYDFQIIQFPLRGVLHDAHYFRLSPLDDAGHSDLFERASDTLVRMLDQSMKWNVESGLLAFVMNFLPPQQNPLGKLMPRQELRNFVYFVERLNEVLSGELRRYRNAYLLDVEQISANIGRKHFQDDSIYAINHASAISNWDFPRDQQRIAPPAKAAEEIYEGKPAVGMRAIWSEAMSMYRAVHQLDAIKLVIVDLDDTLWRGLLVEDGGFTSHTTEGWPLGLAEALLFLKKRGLLLAIASRNDNAKIEAIWDHVWQGRITLDDFVVRKINWGSKIDSVGAILAETNILAKDVVFIDDNPRERAQIEAAFPEIRVLGADLYTIRRVLLWSSETQPTAITAESARRTELVRARVEREGLRDRSSRSDFLAGLDIRTSAFEIRGIAEPRFTRLLELLNRTNQFNTTGRRWTIEDCQTFFSAGGMFCGYEMEDRFAKHGIISAAALRDDMIEQFVMSCRVAGLDVERTIVSDLCDRIRCAGFARARASLVATDSNGPCRNLFGDCGFAFAGGVWQLDLPSA